MKAFLKRQRAFLTVLLIAAAVLALARMFLFHTVRIQGNSMVETLRNGEIVLVTRFDYCFGGAPERGDIVQCRFPGRSGTYIKRVIGLPGETVKIRDGRTHINGAPLSEPYAFGYSEDYSAQLGGDEYLLLGDNRAESYDSRAADMGFVHSGDLLGQVRFVLWPFRSIG